MQLKQESQDGYIVYFLLTERDSVAISHFINGIYNCRELEWCYLEDEIFVNLS